MRWALSPRRWLGPLGRYRPGVFRRDLTRAADAETPGWLRWLLPRWASPEERLLASLALRGRIVYDIGAFRGAYTLFFAAKVGAAGMVVAFEPQMDNFSRLRLRLERHRVANVRALPFALGARSETRTMYRLPAMVTTASLAAEARTLFRQRAGEARIEPLDRLRDTLHLPPPDFMKVDVEGLELEVLRGAADTLARFRPELLIEVHGEGRGPKAERVRQVAEWLEPLGYRLLHAESGRTVTAARPRVATGHLYARASES